MFHPISLGELAALAQFAIEASKIGVLSRDTVARIFNSDFESENQQSQAEAAASGESFFELTTQHAADMQDRQFENQVKQQEFNNKLAEKAANQPKPTGGGDGGKK
jgi:hypothetical protein